MSRDADVTRDPALIAALGSAALLSCRCSSSWRHRLRLRGYEQNGSNAATSCEATSGQEPCAVDPNCSLLKDIQSPLPRILAMRREMRESPLHGALHLVRARKPSLDNPLVLVRYRELRKLPPCPGLEACPGAGYAISELERAQC